MLYRTVANIRSFTHQICNMNFIHFLKSKECNPLNSCPTQGPGRGMRFDEAPILKLSE